MPNLYSGLEVMKLWGKISNSVVDYLTIAVNLKCHAKDSDLAHFWEDGQEPKRKNFLRSNYL